MAERIILTFSGWCECSPEQIKFVYTGGTPLPVGHYETITGREWLALPEYDEDAICRDDYTLEDTLEAQITALDGLYDHWSLNVEEE